MIGSAIIRILELFDDQKLTNDQFVNSRYQIVPIFDRTLSSEEEKSCSLTESQKMVFKTLKSRSSGELNGRQTIVLNL